jgi:hypothetical protein
MRFLCGKGGYFEKSSKGSKTSDMTSEGLGELFEGDSADTCAKKFPLVSMGGRACADGERGPPSSNEGMVKFLGLETDIMDKRYLTCFILLFMELY